MSGSASDAVDRNAPPPPGRIRSFEVPAVEPRGMDNGLALRVARIQRLPIVSVALTLDAGESTVAPGAEGLAVLAADSLEGGTARRSGADLAEALEGLGASLSASAGWDAAMVSLSCLRDRLEDAVALLSEVVLEPAFPDDEVARARGQRLAAIEQRRKDPARLADDQAAAFIFGDGVPYGRPVAGTRDSVAGLGPQDVSRFAAERYRPGRGGLVVSGDVEPAGVEALVGKHFGAWGGSSDAAAAPAVHARSRERAVHLVDRPAAVQSEIRVGQVGAARTSPDYFALLVVNTVLGGAFTSRLNLKLREERGFTYGVRSRFAFRRAAGPFSIATAVETAVTAQAVADTLAEVERLAADGPDAGEVEAAKDYLIGVFPLRMQTTAQVAARVAEILVYGLADDYHATYRDRVRAVTAREAAAAFRRHVRPAEMAVVVVGDADRLRRPLEALELGPVHVHAPP